jgi:hypothetical protein
VKGVFPAERNALCGKAFSLWKGVLSVALNWLCQELWFLRDVSEQLANVPKPHKIIKLLIIYLIRPIMQGQNCTSIHEPTYTSLTSLNLQTLYEAQLQLLARSTHFLGRTPAHPISEASNRIVLQEPARSSLADPLPTLSRRRQTALLKTTNRNFRGRPTPPYLGTHQTAFSCKSHALP